MRLESQSVFVGRKADSAQADGVSRVGGEWRASFGTERWRSNGTSGGGGGGSGGGGSGCVPVSSCISRRHFELRLFNSTSW